MTWRYANDQYDQDRHHVLCDHDRGDGDERAIITFDSGTLVDQWLKVTINSPQDYDRDGFMTISDVFLANFRVGNSLVPIDDTDPNYVPEPASCAWLSLGAIALLASRRR